MQVEPIINEYYEDIKHISSLQKVGFLYTCVHKKTKKSVLLCKERHGRWSQPFFIKMNILLDLLSGSEDVSQLYYMHQVRGYFYVVCEYSETNLSNINKAKLSDERYKRYIIYQLLRLLKYAHSAGVTIHYLKPEHIGITSDDKIKLDAFVPTLINGSGESGPNSGAPSSPYSSPEELLWLSNSELTTAVDMWSLGCILGMLLSKDNKPPFDGELPTVAEFVGVPERYDFKSTVADIVLNNTYFTGRRRDFREIYPNAPEYAMDLLKKLLQLLPANRITAAEALKHPYLAEFHNSLPEIDCPFEFNPPTVDRKKIYSQMSNAESYKYMEELIMKKIREKIYEPINNATILAHNIARSSAALDLLPIEIWTLIFTHMDLPRVKSGYNIAKEVFAKYFGDKK